jgi:hypothetical protein
MATKGLAGSDVADAWIAAPLRTSPDYIRRFG